MVRMVFKGHHLSTNLWEEGLKVESCVHRQADGQVARDWEDYDVWESQRNHFFYKTKHGVGGEQGAEYIFLWMMTMMMTMMKHGTLSD